MMKRYDLPQKLLHKGQKLLHKGHFFIAAVFLLTALLGIPAAAESFRMVSVGDGTEGRRTKVGGVYFWGEGHDIYISNDCKNRHTSYCNGPNTYSEANIKDLSGEKNFGVDDYEVYSVLML